jgi:hypothetical protein
MIEERIAKLDEFLRRQFGRERLSALVGHTPIEVGQRYRDARLTAFGMPSRTVWVVSRIWTDLDGLLHTQLVNDNDPGRRKTISTTTLVDNRQFIRIGG